MSSMCGKNNKRTPRRLEPRTPLVIGSGVCIFNPTNEISNFGDEIQEKSIQETQEQINGTHGHTQQVRNVGKKCTGANLVIGISIFLALVGLAFANWAVISVMNEKVLDVCYELKNEERDLVIQAQL